MPKLRQRKASSYKNKKGKMIKVNPQNFDLEMSKDIAAKCGWGKDDELIVMPLAKGQEWAAGANQAVIVKV